MTQFTIFSNRGNRNINYRCFNYAMHALFAVHLLTFVFFFALHHWMWIVPFFSLLPSAIVAIVVFCASILNIWIGQIRDTNGLRWKISPFVIDIGMQRFIADTELSNTIVAPCKNMIDKFFFIVVVRTTTTCKYIFDVKRKKYNYKNSNNSV